MPIITLNPYDINTSQLKSIATTLVDAFEPEMFKWWGVNTPRSKVINAWARFVHLRMLTPTARVTLIDDYTGVCLWHIPSYLATTTKPTLAQQLYIKWIHLKYWATDTLISLFTTEQHPLYNSRYEEYFDESVEDVGDLPSSTDDESLQNLQKLGKNAVYALYRPCDMSFIDLFAIHPDYQSLNKGRLLYQSVEAQMPRDLTLFNAAPKSFLKSSKAAQQFWEKMGYQKTIENCEIDYCHFIKSI